MIKYNNCLKDTKKRTDLKLCPEGYCTARQKFKVYPSAYANGYASQVCKGSKPDYKGKYISKINTTKKNNNGLNRWFKENWVNVCLPKKDGKYQICGRKKAIMNSKNYPYCRPEFRIDKNTPKTVSEIINENGKKALTNLCKKKK